MNRTLAYVCASAVVAVLAAASRLAVHSMDRSNEEPVAKSIRKSKRPLPPGAQGSVAPDVSFHPIEVDKPIRLSGLRGKPVVLAFGSCT